MRLWLALGNLHKLKLTINAIGWKAKFKELVSVATHSLLVRSAGNTVSKLTGVNDDASNPACFPTSTIPDRVWQRK